MRHIEQLSVREIAAIAGMPEGTVKSRLARGVLLLQELLSGDSLGGNGMNNLPPIPEARRRPTLCCVS